MFAQAGAEDKPCAITSQRFMLSKNGPTVGANGSETKSMIDQPLPTGTTLLLKDGQVLTPDANWHKPPQLDVAVAGDRIAAVAPGFAGAVPAGVQTIDARGHLVLPGFINAHYHSHDVL